jgi:hypothetical protein
MGTATTAPITASQNLASGASLFLIFGFSGLPSLTAPLP